MPRHNGTVISATIVNAAVEENSARGVKSGMEWSQLCTVLRRTGLATCEQVCGIGVFGNMEIRQMRSEIGIWTAGDFIP